MDSNRVNDDRSEEKNGRSGKNRFWTGVLAGALVTALAGLVVVGMSAGIYLFAQGMMSRQPAQSQDQEARPAQGENAIDYGKLTSKMQLIERIIDQYFLYDKDAETVEDYAYLGMMAGLGDPYSTYYNAGEFQSMQDSTSGTYYGIGAMISQNRSTGLCTVVRVYEDTPAMEAGMLPGDVIYQVGDVLVAGQSLDVLVNNYIKGEEGTPVEITVYRADQDAYVDLTVTRKKIEVPTVESRMEEDGVGYVLITEFDGVTVSQFEEALKQLEAQGMERLILDLRSNPGGLLDGAVSMADYILPDDRDDYEKGGGKTLIVYTADKNGQGDVYAASDGHQLDLPIVVLVNGQSASAAEVFTGALKDYGAAEVVGTATYGKGIVQNVIPLGDGSAVKITTAHYYTPSGFDLHGKGIEPDVEVDLEEELKTQAVVAPEEDNQLRRALEIVKEME